MLRNYITIAVRVLLRQKVYSFINVSGLAIGIAATLLIVVYIVDELSYDRFHKDADRIFRLVCVSTQNGIEISSAKIGSLWAEALQNEFPETESVIRLNKMIIEDVIYYQDKEFAVKNLIFADSNFFEFFSFQLLEGSPKDALRGPNKAVITESAAKQYFGYSGVGHESPIGKTMLITTYKRQIEVTGIVKDPPRQSHFHFDVVASIELSPDVEPSFLGTNRFTYFKTREPDGGLQIAQKSSFMIDKYVEPELQKFGTSLKAILKQGDYINFVPQRLVDIHLDSHLINQEFEINGSRNNLYILGIIAISIVVLACINFVNLATARAVHRAKEVGIRKTVGAIRSRLARQFMTESFIYCVLSVLLGMGLISLALTPFNSLTNKPFTLANFGSPSFLLSLVGLLLLITILAGAYPAFVLTSFKPSQVLKGRIHSISKGAGIRNTLVIFQFVISASMIISSLVIRNQIEFMITHNPGFDQSNVICISNAYALNTNQNAFKSELLSHKGIASVSYSSRIPSQRYNQAAGFRRLGDKQWQALYYNWADVDHAKVLGFGISEGRFFSDQYPSDSASVVINQAAADLLGIQSLARKEYLEIGGQPSPSEVIGITEDFNFESLRAEVRPLIIYFPNPRYLSKVSIRVEGRNLPAEIQTISDTWRKHSSAPFEYTFLDENLAAQYKSEELLGRITMVFTSLAIIIACVGLLGLVTYITNQRTKEIGIRKVMGAGVTQIITLISRDFVRLIIIALIIAIPLTWYATNRWLEGFAYHIDFSLVLAGISGGVVLLIAILTISFQSLKAALSNPVDSLRNE